MDQCLISNVRFGLIVILTLCTALGIYTFHVKITCRNSRNKKICARNSFFITLGLMSIAASVVILYYIHKQRQDSIDQMLNDPLPDIQDIRA